MLSSMLWLLPIALLTVGLLWVVQSSSKDK